MDNTSNDVKVAIINEDIFKKYKDDAWIYTRQKCSHMMWKVKIQNMTQCINYLTD